MYTHHVQIRVCYADTDQMGYVYYGNYARYFEIARVECLRNLGFSYKELEASGIMMPVFEYNTRYMQPAQYDDLLTVKVTVHTLPKVRMVFDYEIYNEQQTLLTTGHTTLVFINRQTKRPCPAPQPLLLKLNPYFTPYA
ncbi:thioesterase family protein [Rhodocytophaga aerolata]|uniref:Thioesterase family protein n=1 Tax=Rhodocytophaga aerolata TaxID=455078 RepID=A0ABT8RHL8_9BACT|nr:thioesterase family protein [Rhodocytophaga aerolata]MDO1450295.1 thioesterase family protein [Rhodocytophaga aerolata]